MGQISRYAETDNKSHTRRFIISISDSYIYDDVNNINEETRKKHKKSMTNLNIDSWIRTFFISLLIFGTISIFIFLIWADINISFMNNHIRGYFISSLLMPVLIITSIVIINDIRKNKYKYDYGINADINDDIDKLLRVFNSYVVDTKTNTIMKLYQLLNIKQSKTDKIYFDARFEYEFKKDNHSEFFEKLSNDEENVIKLQAEKISDFTKDELYRCLKIISSYESINRQKKLAKLNKKYSVNTDMHKQQLQNYTEMINELQEEYNKLSHETTSSKM